jgi:Spy/CpxP family protein refolding chaperone
MSKKRLLYIGGTLLAATALALPMALHADGEAWGRFGSRHGPGVRHILAGGAPIISIALKHQNELKLSADQVANLEKTRTHYQNQTTPLHEKLKALESELATLMQETPANLVQIKEKIQEAEKIRSELRYLRVEALENGKTILTTEQRDQLKNMFMSRRGGHRRSHGQPS